MMAGFGLLRSVRCLSVAAQASQRVGFIGLGNMGGHMARNLDRAGCSVVLHDVNVDTANALASNCSNVRVCV